MAETTYPPAVATQPAAARKMDATAAPPTPGQTQTDGDVMRLRGGCPGRLCGLPILPCRCDICIIPIPCCC
ncbi:hypothetical protein Q8F55_001454 [Vanrija albida]|uniref:Cysteine-rich transmembrane CYSTM domain-containing protein n=1 Tax=Vanrija albida TaxID=181172 RepID=A0ABR3QG91_9TREE